MIQFLLAKPDPESPEGKWLDVPKSSDVFSYHVKNSGRVLIAGLLMAAIVEAVALHVLLAMWNHWVALAATLATAYFCLQVICQIRAMGLRPIYVSEGRVMVRNGAFDLVEIPLSSIASIEESTKDVKHGQDELPPLNAGFPASHNVIIHLKDPSEALILNRKKRDFQVVLLAIDENRRFVRLIEENLTTKAPSNEDQKSY